VHPGALGLDPRSFLRSVDATRATVGKRRMKLIDVVARTQALTRDAPYAIIGGLAQILYARKSHTDDVDVALAASDLASAYSRVRGRRAPGWALPKAPDEPHAAPSSISSHSETQI
jgi:hypothetical protein